METPNNKYNPIANFSVRDLPTLKKLINKVTPEDMALVKPIWVSSIERCYYHELPVEKTWLDNENGLRHFAAYCALQRKKLREMYSFGDDQRGQSLEQLRWLHTTDDLAGFYPENLSYTMPINVINPKTSLFDLQPHKDDSKKRRALKGSKSKKALEVERTVSYTYKFWAHKSELVIPTIHNIPPDVAIFVSERTGRKLSLTGIIKEGGGSPYHALIWLRKNDGASIEEAILKSIEILSKEMKKEGKMNFEQIIRALVKSFTKIPEATIRQIVIDNWTEEGKDMSLEAIKENLSHKSYAAKACTVWDENLDSVDFPSTEFAAEAMGYTTGTLNSYISKGKKTANGYWITRGNVPDDLKIVKEWNEFMDVNAKMLHIFLKDRVSPLEEQVYFERLKEKDLSVVAKNLNLKKTKVVHILDKVMDIMNTEFSFINKSETEEKLPMETISADPDTHPKIFRERSGAGSGDTEFNPYPNKGLPSLTIDTSGASNVNRAGKEVTDDEEVTSK